MRRSPILALILAIPAAALAQPAAAAEWSTSYGRMELPDVPEPGPLRAEYSSDEGRIIGTLRQPKCLGCGLEFDGIWVEAGAAQAGAREQDGSLYWGAVGLQFDAGFTSFAGKWNYCGEGKTYDWRGQLGTRMLILDGGR